MLSKVELQAIAQLLNEVDHYQILKIPRHASEDEIRTAFHREALLLHPDQYQHLKDKEILDLSKKIYSRVIESYRVLSSTERRKDYDRKLKGGLNTKEASVPQAADQGLTPFDQDENETTSIRRIEKTATTSAGAKFYKLAQAAFQTKDLNSAKMNIQIALNTDAKNPEYLDLAHRIDADIARKKKSQTKV